MRGLFDRAAAFTARPRGARERAADVRLERFDSWYCPIGRGPKTCALRRRFRGNLKTSRFLARFAAVFLLLAVGLVACRSDPRVIVSTRSGKAYTVRVEVADTPAKRAMGLQYRRELADDQGMLFLFPAEELQTFWMQNTPISLDMIFIGGNLRIVGIVHDAVPFSTTTLSVGAPSQFVLEIRGGMAKRQGVEVGDAVRFEGISLDQISLKK